MIVRRRDGFPGEHHLIVPQSVVSAAQHHRLTSPLFPTAAGYFPNAGGHHVVRNQGVDQTIMIMCWSGKGWFELGQQRRNVMAGDVVFIPADTPHAYGAHDDDPWSIIWAHAVGRDLSLFQRELGITEKTHLMRVSAQAMESIDFHRVYQVLEDGYTLPHIISSSSALRIVLAEMLRNKMAPRGPRDSEGDAVARAETWMKENLGRRASLTELSRHVGMSGSHFSAVFRQKMGYPPMDYFVRLKVQRACKLLDTTSAGMKEVAAAIGYPDPFYFSRLFRHVMGIPPRSYRALAKG